MFSIKSIKGYKIILDKMDNRNVSLSLKHRSPIILFYLTGGRSVLFGGVQERLKRDCILHSSPERLVIHKVCK